MFDMIINSSLATQAQMTTNINKSLLKISTGSKNSDISKFNNNLVEIQTYNKSMQHSLKNTNQAIAFNQLMYNDLREQQNILNQIHSKLILLNNGALSQNEGDALGSQIQDLAEKIDYIANEGKYGDTYYLQENATSNNASDTRFFQLGKTPQDFNETISVRSNTTGYNLEAGLKNNAPTSQTAANQLTSVESALETISNSISQVHNNISILQDFANEFQEKIIANNAIIANIDNVDYAYEQEQYTNFKNIHQASLFSMKKANALQSSILRLLDPQLN